MAKAHLKLLLKKAGVTPTALAREIGVDKSQITRWSQRKVPAERVLDVERITGISRHRLRPDVFGPVAKPQEGAAA